MDLTIVKSIVGAMCIVRRPSVTYGSHYCILCSFDLARKHLAIDTLYMYVSLLSEISYHYYYNIFFQKT